MDMNRERRQLTPDEQDACAEFKRLLLSSTKSQETIAGEIGVTQGAVWQWAMARIPISAAKARAAADAVGADPSAISVAFRELHSPELAAMNSSGRPSQPVGIDGEMLVTAQRWVEVEEGLGAQFSPEERTLRMAQVYNLILADGRDFTPAHAVEFAKAAEARYLPSQGAINVKSEKARRRARK